MNFSEREKTIFILLWLVLLPAIAASPLFHDGWILSHDSGCHLDRIASISHEIQNGDFYPRWISAPFFGKGLPVLNYYSPLFYLTAGYLHAFGVPFVQVLRIICIPLFFLGAWGMFLWTRRNYGEIGALITAAIYTFLPYHFLDVYVRGAISEFAALALLPFLFYAIDLLLSDDRQPRQVLLAAAVTALLILTHNLSAFMTAPFAAAYFAWRAYALRVPLRKILIAGIALLLGAGLSAFYWLPVVLEIGDLSHFRESIVGTFTYTDHFVYPAQWVSSFWGFGDSVAGPNDAMSFQLGYVLLLFLCVALLSLLFSRGKTKGRGFSLVTLALGLFGLFLTTSASSRLYAIVSPLQLIEFPWRFLGLSTLFLSAATGVAAGFRPVTAMSRGPLMLLLLACALGVLLSGPQRSVKERVTRDLDSFKKMELRSGDLGTPDEEGEYLPRWALKSVTSLKLGLISVPAASALQVTNIEKHGTKIRFDTDGREETDIAVTSFYFPGWKATVDGKDIPLGHTPEGFIQIEIPSGRHSVRLWFGTTWPRITGWLITLATLISLVLFRFRITFARFFLLRP